MQTSEEFGFRQLFTHVIGEVAKAVAMRDGEAAAEQTARARATTFLIMSLLPRDALEAMLAGHCVMFHQLITDAVGQILGCVKTATRSAARNTLVNMNKQFIVNLDHLKKYQERPAEGRRDGAAQPPAAPSPVAATAIPAMPAAADEAETFVTAAPAARAETSVTAPAAKAKTSAAPALAKDAEGFVPTPAMITLCLGNPAAMAALENCDAAGFARALGVNPTAEYIAAAGAQMRSLRRQEGAPGSKAPAAGEARAVQAKAPGLA